MTTALDIGAGHHPNQSDIITSGHPRTTIHEDETVDKQNGVLRGECNSSMRKRTMARVGEGGIGSHPIPRSTALNAHTEVQDPGLPCVPSP